MERTYINEFHKQWIETTLQSIESWKKQPISLEEKKKQQEMLNHQRAIREGKEVYKITSQLQARISEVEKACHEGQYVACSDRDDLNQYLDHL